eukprot:gb/GEZJ01004165.1/.p1 GENE.gb/GEZJ01004165.1/~~gb/GEZJ01004165.1/.p1  ORF type:complete len:452 (+),score=62.90 gb/GEZJ01004165.1/:183-1538(+)
MTDSPSVAGVPPSSLWLRFTGYDAPHFELANIVIEFCRSSRREFSPLVRAIAPMQFSSPIDCKLARHGSHSFALYVLKPRSVSITNSPAALFRFSVDAAAIFCQLQKTNTEPQQSHHSLTLCLSTADGLRLSYEASLHPPLYTSTEQASVLPALEQDVLSVSAPHKLRSPRPLDLSFSSVSDDGDSAEDSPRASHALSPNRCKLQSKLRFSDTLQFIPTTQQLKHDADLATAERAILSRGLGDLAAQLARLQHQLRQVNQSVQISHLPVAPHPSVPRAVNHPLQLPVASAKRKRVVLDGHSVARSYGRGKFRPQGIPVALRYYHARGFNAVAVVSKRALEFESSSRDSSRDALAQLIDSGLVAVTTPHSRREEFILNYALDHNAYVVSNESLQAGAMPRCFKRDQRRVQSFLDSHTVPFMFIANEFVPTSPSLRRVKSSDCVRTHCRRDSF